MIVFFCGVVVKKIEKTIGEGRENPNFDLGLTMVALQRGSPALVPLSKVLWNLSPVSFLSTFSVQSYADNMILPFSIRIHHFRGTVLIFGLRRTV
jgi:hypothetical protein